MTPQPPKTAGSTPRGLAKWLFEQRWWLVVFAAALVVRLHWNLVVHPVGDYIFSDMNGYVTRADRMLRDPWTPHEYSAFFPFGTHALLAGLKQLFGAENYPAVGFVYATFGALTVGLAYSVARRASHFASVPPAVALIGILYYPHLSLGGYILSEVPFCLALVASLFFCLRLVDHGRHRDAWFLGLACGFGALIRPQILLSAAVVGVFWLWRRHHLGQMRWRHLAQAAIPLALLLAAASTHLHHHTGRRGLVSENGSFNLVFGRCHNVKIESRKGASVVHFKPPPFLQVRNIEDQAARKGRTPSVRLNPAIGRDIEYQGYIGDREIHQRFIQDCWQKTGLAGQLGYAWTNVKLLWLYNIAWPDSGVAAWRPYARWWSTQQRIWFAIPALLGLAWMFVPNRKDTQAAGRRGSAAKMGLVAVNLLAILVLASIFFGGARHRTPYDFIILILALETYAVLFSLGWRRGLPFLRTRLGAGNHSHGSSAATDRVARSSQNSSSEK